MLGRLGKPPLPQPLEVSTVYKAEHPSCLIDAGHIKSIGWFVTQRLDAIEIGLCPFDGSFSGFRWNEETGWEPISYLRGNVPLTGF